MASYTSCRCTEISIGAAIPNRTLSPRMSTTVMTISSPMMILSSRCRDRTSIVNGSFLLPARPATIPDHAAHALGDHDGAQDGTSPGIPGMFGLHGSRRRTQRGRPGQQVRGWGAMPRVEGIPDRVTAAGQDQLPAQAADRVEHQGALEVHGDPPPFATVQDHVDQGGSFVVELQGGTVPL